MDRNYACPRRGDFEEARDLNLAFLTMLRGDTVDAGHFGALDPEFVARLRCLGNRQVERLARVPFLLMAFREDDRRLWEQTPAASFVHEPSVATLTDTVRERLLAAGLGFAWQLARRNPYGLRLLSGASVRWCERLAEQPLLEIVRRLGECSDLPRLRSAGDDRLWRKLLTDGVSPAGSLRRAAQLSSLHMRLTQPPKEVPRWAAAACRTRVPTLTLRGPSKPS